VGVELEDLRVVVPPRADRSGDPAPLLGSVGVGPLPVVARRGREPAPPAEAVGDDGAPDDGQERQGRVLEEPGPTPPGDPGRAAGAHVPQDGHQPEGDDEVETRPLRPGAQPQAQPGRPAVGTPSHRGAEPGHPVPGEGGDPAGQHRSRVVPVDEQEAEPGEAPEHDDEVEQPGARLDEVVTLEGQKQRGHRAEERGAEEPSRGPSDHEDRQGAHHRDRKAPAEGAVDPEQLLAPADEPLADRGVDDEVADRGVVDRAPVAGGEVLVDLLGGLQGRVVALLDAELDQRPALLDVVRLVEDQLVGVAEVPEPQEPADRGGGERPEPAEKAVSDRLSEQPPAQPPLPRHGGHRMQARWVCRVLAPGAHARPGQCSQLRWSFASV